MSREIEIVNYAEHAVDFEGAKLRELVRALDSGLPENLRAPSGLLSLAIFDEEQLAQIHGDFLGDPSPTDVITFDGEPEEDFAGEICVSAQRALECAANFGNTPEDELRLYISHGYLHLAGLDDMTEDDAQKMRKGEAMAMSVLSAALKAPIFSFKKIHKI